MITEKPVDFMWNDPTVLFERFQLVAGMFEVQNLSFPLQSDTFHQQNVESTEPMEDPIVHDCLTISTTKKKTFKSPDKKKGKYYYGTRQYHNLVKKHEENGLPQYLPIFVRLTKI